MRRLLKSIATKADIQRLVAAKEAANQYTLRLKGLDADLFQARMLLPRLDENDRADLAYWIDRVTGGGSGVMSADIGEANHILEGFRGTLRTYRRKILDDRQTGKSAAAVRAAAGKGESMA